MGRAKIGTGTLTPFKKGGTGSESIGGSTSREESGQRKGFTKKIYCDKASQSVTKLVPFSDSGSGGRNTGEGGVPNFRVRDNGIKNPGGYRAFRK